MDDLQNTPWSRRRLSLLASGAIASLLLGLSLDADGEAKRKGKKRRRKNRSRNGNDSGDTCLGEAQACTTSPFPGNGGCCEGLACDCGMPLCIVGIPGACLHVVDPD
jgi:hypothetical protein